MSLGVIMLVHDALGRAAQVARHWRAAGCPVVIHVDANTGQTDFDALRSALGDDPLVQFCERHRCEWGTWGIVAATQSAAGLLLARHGDLGHVLLTSGSCLPLRPVSELIAYLARHPDTDFIESATTAEVPWTVGGLDEERFTLRFPFAWKKHRRLFDCAVNIQRRIGWHRRIPAGIRPHMGSQWWCLTGATLRAILTDPRRAEFERYFRQVWIPDESYYQSLARRHSGRIESRSLTLSRFDFQGKPHVFYDDHLQLLRRSSCFLARKIWPHAEGLYRAFLGDGQKSPARADPAPARIDRLFLRATERRTRGQPGLYMQSRHPNPGWENGLTAAPYSVLGGFAELFDDFPGWLARATAARVHGHLFAPGRAEFCGGESTVQGALSDSAAKRDYDPRAFLTSLVWNTRGEHQAFLFGPRDNQQIAPFLAADPNARITVILGAWAVPLFRSARPFADLRREAAALQRIESAHLELLRQPRAGARIRVWSMADFIEAPLESLQVVIDNIVPGPKQHLTPLPRLVDLDGFGQFLQDLRNQGMHPYLMGDFPLEQKQDAESEPSRKPYLVHEQ
ncbi:DUF5927 domain-containing protein [Pontibaca methylaminivorans]|uniref:Peptide O-xylosyltransferase n=1 Tax=Pontibaca methylaminivorans TaxID=515897 RepID=A0A1R3X300_9RHOB|nr:beta-1,6-N-acetylglucosaminyltransferase [Pontibaca methylaminivorans]SIT85307.1 Core-2/I-Branching enzyme [Pontibaca methylaminivorans]